MDIGKKLSPRRTRPQEEPGAGGSRRKDLLHSLRGISLTEFAVPFVHRLCRRAENPVFGGCAGSVVQNNENQFLGKKAENRERGVEGRQGAFNCRFFAFLMFSCMVRGAWKSCEASRGCREANGARIDPPGSGQKSAVLRCFLAKFD